MRTKTRAKARLPRSSRRSVSASTRPLPSPVPEHSSDAEGEEKDSMDRMELDISSENDGKESNRGSESSDDEIANTCLKCNKGGKLLVCCGTGCAICLHDECIPCKPKFDEDGNFYCPYCWYKINQAKAEELRKVALLAKKALRDFMNSKPVEVVEVKAKQNGQKTEGNDANTGSVMKERNCCEHLNRMDVDDEVRNGTPNVENNHQNDKNVKLPKGDQSTVVAGHEGISEFHEFEVLDDEEKMEQGKGSEQVGVEHHAKTLRDEELKEISDHQHTKEETVVDRDGALHGSPELKSEALKVTEGNQVCEEVQEEIHNDAPGANGSVGNDVTDVPKMSHPDYETIAERLRRGKQAINQNPDSQKTSSSYPHNTSAEEAEKASPLKKSRQPQEPARKLTNLSFSHEKRKRLHWKPEEEEMLREGVQKFSSKINKNVPWRKILEFGRHIFDGSRTPADLKDKWRNIVAKESSENNFKSS